MTVGFVGDQSVGRKRPPHRKHAGGVPQSGDVLPGLVRVPDAIASKQTDELEFRPNGRGAVESSKQLVHAPNGLRP